MIKDKSAFSDAENDENQIESVSQPRYCNLQLWLGNEEYDFCQQPSNLKIREGKFLQGDDNDEISPLRNVFTETNFRNVEDHVEKSVVDLFGEGENEGNASNIYFMGSLDKLNVLFYKNSWAYAREDVLKLPNVIQNQ